MKETTGDTVKPLSKAGSPKLSRVLIVDDHPTVREGLALRIARQPDLEVCGEAADVADALRLVESTQPDVAVIDISLKTGSGLELIKRIKAHNHAVRMLVWSMHSDTHYAERALRAGAMGYINKEQATDQIIVAIRQVLAGKIFLAEPLAGQLLGRNVGGTTVRSPIEALTDREIEVLRFVGEGLTAHQIGVRMRVSSKTVETYQARLKEKLNLPTRTELLRYAVEWLLQQR